MEGSGGAFQPGLVPSSPEVSRPPVGLFPERAESSSSSGSESSEEDWLIKVCCPGARHRYPKHGKPKKPSKSGVPHKLDKEDDSKEPAEWMPLASYQTYPGVQRQESSDLKWLVRVRCPRALMEQRRLDRKQSLPPVSSSRSPSKIYRNGQFEKASGSENWLTQKDFNAQDVVKENQDIVVSARSLLERENCFMREVDRYLKHNDFLALRRKEMLYKKWFENVSSPLLQKIQDKIDNQSSEEIEERRRKQLSQYLKFCNKKGNVIKLDHYNASLYDPFFLQESTNFWKASVPPLYDPLLKEIQGRYLEAGIIQQCDTGKIYTPKEINELHKIELPLLPLSRQLMTPLQWLRIQFGYMESEVRQRSRRKMRTTRNVSSMDFKSWGDQTWLIPSMKHSSTRKPDFTSMSNLLAKRPVSGPSVWKSAIKSAS